MSSTKKTESPLSPLLLDLEQNTALDGGIALLQPALDSLSSKDGIGGVLRGKQMGHALHPVMVQLPLGTFMSAALLDVTGADRSGRSAQLLTGVGLASVLPSILTGLAELATASSEEKPERMPSEPCCRSAPCASGHVVVVGQPSPVHSRP